MVMPGFHGRTWTRRPGIQGVEGRHLAPIFFINELDAEYPNPAE